MARRTIGEIARECGVNVETIRFYERNGLIPIPPRPAAGFRQYPEETVGRIRFIRRSKALGFTLREIEELLSLRVDTGTTCDRVRQRTEAKIADIERKIEALAEIKKTLLKLSAACRGGHGSECPILKALEGGERGPSQGPTHRGRRVRK